ncbi:MAG TPA: roadblock/LC7 domain-containing protein [Chloroflexi bacterium]|nr:roadblock/LC7 domain-containing protein [Chloroflexota bacterium]
MLPKGLDFTENQMEQIESILRQLYWDTEAQSILLADITGQLISVLGESNVNTSALSALAAGNLAATREMARLVGEPARFKLLLHEGEQRSVYLSDVDGELVLVAIFGQRTPIGLVRLSTQIAIQKLAPIVIDALEAAPHQSVFISEETDSLADGIKESWDSVFGNNETST